MANEDFYVEFGSNLRQGRNGKAGFITQLKADIKTVQDEIAKLKSSIAEADTVIGKGVGITDRLARGSDPGISGGGDSSGSAGGLDPATIRAANRGLEQLINNMESARQSITEDLAGTAAANKAVAQNMQESAEILRSGVITRNKVDAALLRLLQGNMPNRDTKGDLTGQQPGTFMKGAGGDKVIPKIKEFLDSQDGGSPFDDPKTPSLAAVPTAMIDDAQMTRLIDRAERTAKNTQSSNDKLDRLIAAVNRTRSAPGTGARPTSTSTTRVAGTSRRRGGADEVEEDVANTPRRRRRGGTAAEPHGTAPVITNDPFARAGQLRSQIRKSHRLTELEAARSRLAAGGTADPGTPDLRKLLALGKTGINNNYQGPKVEDRIQKAIASVRSELADVPKIRILEAQLAEAIKATGTPDGRRPRGEDGRLETPLDKKKTTRQERREARRQGKAAGTDERAEASGEAAQAARKAKADAARKRYEAAEDAAVAAKLAAVEADQKNIASKTAVIEAHTSGDDAAVKKATDELARSSKALADAQALQAKTEQEFTKATRDLEKAEKKEAGVTRQMEKEVNRRAAKAQRDVAGPRMTGQEAREKLRRLDRTGSEEVMRGFTREELMDSVETFREQGFQVPGVGVRNAKGDLPRTSKEGMIKSLLESNRQWLGGESTAMEGMSYPGQQTAQNLEKFRRGKPTEISAAAKKATDKIMRLMVETIDDSALEVINRDYQGGGSGVGKLRKGKTDQAFGSALGQEGMSREDIQYAYAYMGQQQSSRDPYSGVRDQEIQNAIRKTTAQQIRQDPSFNPYSEEYRITGDRSDPEVQGRRRIVREMQETSAAFDKVGTAAMEVHKRLNQLSDREESRIAQLEGVNARLRDLADLKAKYGSNTPEQEESKQHLLDEQSRLGNDASIQKEMADLRRQLRVLYSGKGADFEKEMARQKPGHGITGEGFQNIKQVFGDAGVTYGTFEPDRFEAGARTRAEAREAQRQEEEQKRQDQAERAQKREAEKSMRETYFGRQNAMGVGAGKVRVGQKSTKVTRTDSTSLFPVDPANKQAFADRFPDYSEKNRKEAVNRFNRVEAAERERRKMVEENRENEAAGLPKEFGDSDFAALDTRLKQAKHDFITAYEKASKTPIPTEYSAKDIKDFEKTNRERVKRGEEPIEVPLRDYTESDRSTAIRKAAQQDAALRKANADKIKAMEETGENLVDPRSLLRKDKSGRTRLERLADPTTGLQDAAPYSATFRNFRDATPEEREQIDQTSAGRHLAALRQEAEQAAAALDALGRSGERTKETELELAEANARLEQARERLAAKTESLRTQEQAKIYSSDHFESADDATMAEWQRLAEVRARRAAQDTPEAVAVADAEADLARRQAAANVPDDYFGDRSAALERKAGEVIGNDSVRGHSIQERLREELRAEARLTPEQQAQSLQRQYENAAKMTYRTPLDPTVVPNVGPSGEKMLPTKDGKNFERDGERELERAKAALLRSGIRLSDSMNEALHHAKSVPALVEALESALKAGTLQFSQYRPSDDPNYDPAAGLGGRPYGTHVDDYKVGTAPNLPAVDDSVFNRQSGGHETVPTVLGPDDARRSAEAFLDQQRRIQTNVGFQADVGRAEPKPGTEPKVLGTYAEVFGKKVAKTTATASDALARALAQAEKVLAAGKTGLPENSARGKLAKAMDVNQADFRGEGGLQRLVDLAKGTNTETAQMSPAVKDAIKAAKDSGFSDDCCTRIVEAINAVDQTLKGTIKVSGGRLSSSDADADVSTGNPRARKVANREYVPIPESDLRWTESEIKRRMPGADAGIGKNAAGMVNDETVGFASEMVSRRFKNQASAVDYLRQRLELTTEAARDLETRLASSMKGRAAVAGVKRGTEQDQRDEKKIQETIDRENRRNKDKKTRDAGVSRDQVRDANDLTKAYDALDAKAKALLSSLKQVSKSGSPADVVDAQEKFYAAAAESMIRTNPDGRRGTRQAQAQRLMSSEQYGMGVKVNKSEIERMSKETEDTLAQSMRRARQDSMGMGQDSEWLEGLFGGKGFMGRVVGSLGTFLVRNFSAGIVFGVTNAMQDMIMQALETEATFIRVSSALEATGRSTSGLRSDLQDISTDYGVALKDVYTTAAGLTGVFESNAEIAQATRVSAQLELISRGALNSTEAMKSLSSVTTAFGMDGVEDLTHIADVLTVIQDRLGVNIEDVVEGGGRLAGQASMLGLDLEEVFVQVAAISKLTGQTGQAAGEQYSRILSQLQTGRGQAALTKNLGPDTGIQAALSTRDYGEALEILLENYGSLNQAQQDNIAVTLGGQRQAAAIQGLLIEGAKVLDVTAAAYDANGQAAQRAADLSKNLNTQIRILQENFVNLMKALVDTGLLNFFGLVLYAVNGLLSGINKVLVVGNELMDSNPLTRFFKDSLFGIIGMVAGLKILTAGIRALKGALHGSAMGNMFSRGAEAARGEGPTAGRPLIPGIANFGTEAKDRKRPPTADQLRARREAERLGVIGEDGRRRRATEAELAAFGDPRREREARLTGRDATGKHRAGPRHAGPTRLAREFNAMDDHFFSGDQRRGARTGLTPLAPDRKWDGTSLGKHGVDPARHGGRMARFKGLFGGGLYGEHGVDPTRKHAYQGDPLGRDGYDVSGTRLTRATGEALTSRGSRLEAWGKRLQESAPMAEVYEPRHRGDGTGRGAHGPERTPRGKHILSAPTSNLSWGQQMGASLGVGAAGASGFRVGMRNDMGRTAARFGAGLQRVAAPMAALSAVMARSATAAAAASGAMGALTIALGAAFMEWMANREKLKTYEKNREAETSGKSQEERDEEKRYAGVYAEERDKNTESMFGPGGMFKALGRGTSNLLAVGSFGLLGDYKSEAEAVGDYSDGDVDGEKAQKQVDALMKGTFGRLRTANLAGTKEAVDKAEQATAREVQELKDAIDASDMTTEQKNSMQADIDAIVNSANEKAAQIRLGIEGLSKLNILLPTQMQDLGNLISAVDSAGASAAEFMPGIDKMKAGIGIPKGSDYEGLLANLGQPSSQIERLDMRIANKRLDLKGIQVQLESTDLDEGLREQLEPQFLQGIAEMEQLVQQRVAARVSMAQAIAAEFRATGNFSGAGAQLAKATADLEEELKRNSDDPAKVAEITAQIRANNKAIQDALLVPMQIRMQEERASNRNPLFRAQSEREEAGSTLAVMEANPDAYSTEEISQQRQKAIGAQQAEADAAQAQQSAKLMLDIANTLNSVTKAALERAAAWDAVAYARAQFGEGSQQELDALTRAAQADQADLAARQASKAAMVQTDISKMAPGDAQGVANAQALEATRLRKEAAQYGETDPRYQQAIQAEVAAYRNAWDVYHTGVDARHAATQAALNAQGDTLGAADAAVTAAQEAVNRAKERSGGKRTTELVNAEAALGTTEAARTDAYNAYATQQSNLSIALAQSQGDTVGAAQKSVEQARSTLRQVLAKSKGKETQAVIDARIALVNNIAQERDATLELVNAHSSLAIAVAEAAGETVQAAILRAGDAQRLLDEALAKSNGKETPEVVKARENKVTADAARRDAMFNEEVTLIEHEREMRRITVGEAIRRYEALMAAGNLTDDQMRQVESALQNLKGGGGDSQWNIGDIKVPTPYEMRRSLLGGYDTVEEAIIGVTGSGAQQAMASAALPGPGGMPMTSSSVSNLTQVKIDINGGDINQVRAVLNQYLGQSAFQRSSMTPTKV